MSCAFADCGREWCPVCRLARVRVISAATMDLVPKNAKAELPTARGTRIATNSPVYNEDGRLIAAPKKKERVGPHR